jgi:shikimate kinase
VGMKRIFLVGYMGAGKTMFGKSLACRMNLNYIDTDHFIENRYRKRVTDIFASEGEERFRQIEHRILLEIAEFEDIVISTGGGLPCFNDNMTIMNNKGITVYLDVPAEALAERLGKNKNARPILKNRFGNELIDFIKEHLDTRKPFYEQAKIRIQTGKMYSKNDVEFLVQKLELFENK